MAQAFLKRSVEDRLDAIEANLNANKVKVNAVEAKLDVIEAKHHAFEVHVMAKLGQVLARLPPPVMTDSTFSQTSNASNVTVNSAPTNYGAIVGAPNVQPYTLPARTRSNPKMLYYRTPHTVTSAKAKRLSSRMMPSTVHHRPANAEAYCTDAAQYSSRVLNTPTTVSQSIAAPAVPTFGAAKNIRTRNPLNGQLVGPEIHLSNSMPVTQPKPLYYPQQCELPREPRNICSSSRSSMTRPVNVSSFSRPVSMESSSTNVTAVLSREETGLPDYNQWSELCDERRDSYRSLGNYEQAAINEQQSKAYQQMAQATQLATPPAGQNFDDSDD